MSRKMTQMNKTIIFVLALILITTGCSSNQTQTQSNTNDPKGTANKKEKILKIASFGDFGTADPAFNAVTTADSEVMETVYNGLVRFKPGSTKPEDVEGDLAEKWENNAEGTIWTFHLRKGVQWQKGYGEFTSADVKWSYERIMDPKTGSPASAYTQSIAKIEAPDKYTVVFYLKTPDATFLLTLITTSNGPGKIVKKEAVEAAGNDYKFNPVGTGPFVFKEHKVKEKVILEKNPNYFKGAPKLDLVEIYNMKEQAAVDIAMDKGDIDMTIGIADTVWAENRRKNKDVVVEYSNHPIYWFLQLNTAMKPYDDIRVRKAIAHAINPKEFVEKVMGVEVAHLPKSAITTNLFGHADIGIYEYNADLSKKYLAEAGYADGIKLPQNFGSSSPTSLNKITWVQEQLRKAGIDMPMSVVDSVTYSQNARKDLNGITLSAASVRPHADFLLTPYYHSKSMVGKPTVNANFTHYDKVDKLIDQARVEMNPEKAKSIYLEIQKQIKEDYITIPLAETKIPMVRRKEVDLGYTMGAIPTTLFLVDEKTDLR
jgi:peptide/nickel transport system substrate-binding protein